MGRHLPKGFFDKLKIPMGIRSIPTGIFQDVPQRRHVLFLFADLRLRYLRGDCAQKYLRTPSLALAASSLMETVYLIPLF